MNWKELKQKKTEIGAGISYFLFLILMGYYTIGMVKKGAVEKGVHLPVLFNSLEGLRTGSLVTVNGIEMGYVGSIRFLKFDGANLSRTEKNQGVIAILDLRSPVSFYSNAEIDVVYNTIIGQKVVRIRPGEKKPDSIEIYPLLLEPDEIVAFSTRDELPRHEKLLLRGENFGDPIYLLSSLLRENRGSLLEITGNLAEISALINRGNGTLSRIINQSSLHDNALIVAQFIRVVLREARELLESNRESTTLVSMIELLFSILISAASGGV